MKARKSSAIFAKTGLSFRTCGGVAMDARGVLRHVALRVDEHVENIAGQALVHNLDSANFQHPMSVGRIEACRFRVEHDFTHGRVLPLASAAVERTN